MHIEQELEGWLRKSIPDTRNNKLRDIKVVLSYYGFGGLVWPTLEEFLSIYDANSTYQFDRVH